MAFLFSKSMSFKFLSKKKLTKTNVNIFSLPLEFFKFFSTRKHFYFSKLLNMKQFTLLIVTCLCLSTIVSAQSIIGTWKTIDDETGLARSHVKVYKAQNGKYYGKIIKLLNRGPNEPTNPVCSSCPKSDKRYNQKIINMIIVSGLSKSGKEYIGGKILDPQKGKIYSCKIWLSVGDKDILKVRGYLGPFYRTQTWYRVD